MENASINIRASQNDGMPSVSRKSARTGVIAQAIPVEGGDQGGGKGDQEGQEPA